MQVLLHKLYFRAAILNCVVDLFVYHIVQCVCVCVCVFSSPSIPWCHHYMLLSYTCWDFATIHRHTMFSHYIIATNWHKRERQRDVCRLVDVCFYIFTALPPIVFFSSAGHDQDSYMVCVYMLGRGVVPVLYFTNYISVSYRVWEPGIFHPQAQVYPLKLCWLLPHTCITFPPQEHRVHSHLKNHDSVQSNIYTGNISCMYMQQLQGFLWSMNYQLQPLSVQ